MNSCRRHSWQLAFVWLGLLGLAAALRAYHLTGFIFNYDEAHWLLYEMDKRLLFDTLRSSRPRPDLFFPLIATIPVKALGPNELALRLWPLLAGSLSILPLGALIFRLTGRREAALIGAAVLAVLPLPVYYSAHGIPDAVALFFGLCALALMMRARETNSRASFIGMGILLALALLTKATALYAWGFLAVAGYFLFENSRQRRTFYGALGLSIIPLAVLALAILLRGQPMAFLHEPGVTSHFGLSLTRLGSHLRSVMGFYGVLLLVAGIGAVVVAIRAVGGSVADLRLLVWLLPIVNLVVTPFFRDGHVELLWLIPSVCLFASVALTALPGGWRWLGTGAVCAVLLVRSLDGVTLPYPGPALAASDYTTAVLDRPAGWPSRDAVRWLTAHSTTDDTILFTAYTFTDPLLLELSRVRHVIPNGGESWELLHDPTNRVRYVVFTHDYHAYVPSLARYADTDFAQPVDARFAGYGIYDCQKGGEFVAYADAYNSSGRYVQDGLEFLKQHQLESALAAFETAQKINPNEAITDVNLALLYYQLGRDADGVTQCERNIRSGIEPAISYGVLGQIRERQGDLSAAETAYDKSLAIDPHNPTTMQLLANLKARRSASELPAK
jgi:hypothetical protein